VSASDLQKAAFTAGGIAYTAGQAASTCPYSDAAPQGVRRLWLRGWARAQDAAGQGIPDEAEDA
jgi:ribosome modulation factor